MPRGWNQFEFFVGLAEKALYILVQFSTGPSRCFGSSHCRGHGPSDSASTTGIVNDRGTFSVSTYTIKFWPRPTFG